MAAWVSVLLSLLSISYWRRGSNFRMPVLAVAVGMYLPMYLDTAIFFGGLIAWLVDRYFKKQSLVTADRTNAKLDMPNANIDLEVRKGNAEKAGLLFASGLITGEALLGVALAIPFGISEKKDDALKLIDNPLPDWIGFGIFLACCSGLYYAVVKSK